MRLFIIILSIGLLFVSKAFAQQSENFALAQQYMASNEYEKAQPLLEKEYNHNPSTEVFAIYLRCLENLKDYKDAEKLCRKHIKRYPDNLEYRVVYGNILNEDDKGKDANTSFEEAVKLLQPDMVMVRNVAHAFTDIHQYDYALKTYEHAGKIFNNDALFFSEIAQVYVAKGDNEKAVSYMLDAAGSGAKDLENIETSLQELMQQKGVKDIVQKELLRRSEKSRDMGVYDDLLVWYYVQQRDFDGAFLQVKAIDMRNHESGYRLVNLAQNAAAEGYYDAAINCYKYVIETKPKTSSTYLEARRDILGVLKNKVIFSTSYTQDDLQLLEKSYEAFLKEYGNAAVNIEAIRDYASIEALYLHNVPKALDILRPVIDANNVPRIWQGQCKLDYGDYELLEGNTWDALLTYGQVEKAFKADELGEQARFRSAKLSYYAGDFDWANTQLKILKGSTTELISNDAINLSVFIMESSGMDSIPVALQIFARGDLLFYENKMTDAEKTYDSIPLLFPEHELNDQVIMQKARIRIKQGKYQEAADLLTQIETNYKFETLADEALFELADLYEHQLNNKTKAQELYQMLITEYKGSVYAIEARKRFRRLRGDILE